MMQDSLQSYGMNGTGKSGHIVDHSLQGTVASLLLESGRPDWTIVMFTGHKQTNARKYYQNLRGNEGRT